MGGIVTTQPDDLEAEVRGLLPCPWHDGKHAGSLNASCCCGARPAVLAALRKQRERADELERKLNEQYRWHTQDINQGIEVTHDLAAKLDAANAQLAEAKAERDALRERESSFGQGERDACAVVGRLARELGEEHARLAHLEAALAKVPHIENGWVVKAHNGMNTFADSCLFLGGQCALTEALAATGGKLE